MNIPELNVKIFFEDTEIRNRFRYFEEQTETESLPESCNQIRYFKEHTVTDIYRNS